MDGAERDAAIRALVKDGDPDRYAASLFAPTETRDRLLALYAFNIELARIAEQVKEPQLGEIRLQWWRDALERGFKGEATGQPVGDAVIAVARTCGLSQGDLETLIGARHFDVSVKRMPGTAALDDYLDKTAGMLFRLAGNIAGAKSSEVAVAAKHVGIAYGLTGLMRSLPVHLAQGRVDIPADALRRHGIQAEDLLAGRETEGLKPLLAEWRTRARESLAASRREIASLGTETRAAFLPLALVEPYLSALERSKEPLREIATINPLYRLWRLATCRFR